MFSVWRRIHLGGCMTIKKKIESRSRASSLVEELIVMRFSTADLF